MTLTYDELRAMPEEERQIKALTDQDQITMAKLALKGWKFAYHSRAGAGKNAMWFITPPRISGYSVFSSYYITLLSAITAALMAEMTREANTSAT